MRNTITAFYPVGIVRYTKEGKPEPYINSPVHLGKVGDDLLFKKRSI